MVLPVSLLALRAFAEVGRCGSVKLAAKSLGVTPGAVSQQVKGLEQRFGVALFERKNREMCLTADGLRLLEPLSTGFRQINDAVGLLAPLLCGREILTVSTTSSLAVSWLIPRLGRFSVRHPEIDVRVETTPSLADLRHDGVDVALRHGTGVYAGLEAVRLLTPRLICVVSPVLAAGRPKIVTPTECLSYPRLQDRDRCIWSAWFGAHGIRMTDEQARSGPSFENDLLLIHAVIAGQGLAIVRDIYAEEELRAERLTLVSKDTLPTDASYFFVASPQAMGKPKVAKFRSWITSESQM